MSVLDLFRLDGKKAVVTGASSGIGKRVALAYLQAGAQVAIAARHSEALDEVAREITAVGDGEVLPISCDVTRPEQAAARAMVKQGRGGVIITTASMSGHVINIPQQEGHYCASKAAVIQLTKAMAVEFAAHNIRVNSVSPGYILTELVEPYTEYHALWEPKIPLGRLGRPDELTGLYLYLASEASSYMTGSDIVIDGGYTSI